MHRLGLMLSGAAAELSNSNNGVGHRPSRRLQASAALGVEASGLGLINQSHASFLQGVVPEKGIVGLNKYINDGVADAHDIQAATAGEAGIGSHTRRWKWFRSMPLGGSGAEERSLGSMDGIFNHDGLIPACAQRNNGDRHFHQVSKKAQIVHGSLRQVLELAAILR